MVKNECLNPNTTVIGKTWQSYDCHCPECNERMDLMVRVKEREIAFICRRCNVISNELQFINTNYKIKLEKISKKVILRW